MTTPRFLNAVSDIGELYAQHITRQLQLTESLCERYGLGYLLIASGTINYHFKDDREYPFKVNPYFKQWLPLTEHPNSYVLLKPGQKPTLFLYQPDNMWLAWPGLGICDWEAERTIASIFTLVEIKHINDITAHLLSRDNTVTEGAFIGPSNCLHSDWPITHINDDTILAYINYHRSYKTDYEIYCLYQANKVAAPGHQKALALFQRGDVTEADIFFCYLSASKITQQDSPYEPFIAFNEHGSILHYQLKSKQAPTEGLRAMLIDAGGDFAGYASDISRTYSYRDDDFSNLITQFDVLQQQLISGIETGQTKADIHNRSCRAVAAFMKTNHFITCSEEEAYDKRLVDFFYPHGLGHFLGLQVHDVGENLVDENGARARPIPRYPKQGNRTLESGMVFTIEPGFYFIDAKLEALYSSKEFKLINWETVKHFRSYGGIRIEDDIYLSEQGTLNLTRMAFCDE